jgi:hypothetical protein
MVILSKRGIPLAGFHTDGPTCNTPTITVELYCKWYTLYLVTAPDQAVEIPFPEMAALTSSPWHDHCPNPEHVTAFCESQGYELDELAHELIVGRWTLERM